MIPTYEAQMNIAANTIEIAKDRERIFSWTLQENWEVKKRPRGEKIRQGQESREEK